MSEEIRLRYPDLPADVAERAIPIPGDVLIPDPDLAAIWHCTTRTLSRYELDGLAVAYVAGRKYRPWLGSGEFLANRIRHPNPRRAA